MSHFCANKLYILCRFICFRSSATSRRGDVTNGRSLQKERSMTGITRAQHMTSVKVFCALFLQLIVSYIPVVIHNISPNGNWKYMYLYFFNHIGNPMAYYAINKQFRQEANQIVRELFEKIGQACRK